SGDTRHRMSYSARPDEKPGQRRSGGLTAASASPVLLQSTATSRSSCDSLRSPSVMGPLGRQRRVEELPNHRNQPLGAIHERDVRGARQHSKLRTRKANGIASNAAAEQSKQLYHVLRTDDIG